MTANCITVTVVCNQVTTEDMAVNMSQRGEKKESCTTCMWKHSCNSWLTAMSRDAFMLKIKPQKLCSWKSNACSTVLQTPNLCVCEFMCVSVYCYGGEVVCASLCVRVRMVVINSMLAS